MAPFRRLACAWKISCLPAAVLLLFPPRLLLAQTAAPAALDHVGVAIVRNGQSVVLATAGLPHDGKLWRFRSLDTSDLPQPLRDVSLAASGTKLLLQPAHGLPIIIDLTQQHQHGMPLQYVDPGTAGDERSMRRHSHRLPMQRFVTIIDAVARIVNDESKTVDHYPAPGASHAALTDDGTLVLAGPDGMLTLCRSAREGAGRCETMAYRTEEEVVAIATRAHPLRLPSEVPRFLLLVGPEDATRLVDPERGMDVVRPMRRAEAALRASLYLQDVELQDEHGRALANALIQESAATWASGGRPITGWRFFAVEPDVELYAPVLQFAAIETVFPTAFDALPTLDGTPAAAVPQPVIDRLYQRYLRLDVAARRRLCTQYFRTHSAPGSWIVEYWLYYPFDAGGLGSHPHDPEHFFVEVDKLGGAPRRVIGAGHGYMAGNNIYRADRRGAQAITLPIFAIVELGKHAMAPDIDRDGVFTPGIDENEYRERAKIWGVRDVIGRINNQLLAFDVTMSVRRRPEDALALVSAPVRFPNGPGLSATPACQLEPLLRPSEASPVQRVLFRLSDWVIVPPCTEPTSECARLHITAHPDYLDRRTILKEWSFPQSFLRTSYGMGPRRGLHTVGLGYAMDLDRVPGVGTVLPLPGRIGGEVFHWRQSLADADRDSCLAGCSSRSGIGWGLRYEQFVSNLFGIFSAARVYSPPFDDAWITFGPMVEMPLGRRSNVNLQGGLSFRPFASPRFELKVTVGLWKPKTNHIGLHAGKDH